MRFKCDPKAQPSFAILFSLFLFAKKDEQTQFVILANGDVPLQ